MTRSTLLVLCGAAFLTACADAPVAPLPAITPEDATAAKRSAGVAALGILTERSGAALVLRQRGLEFTAAAGVTGRAVRHDPSIGRVGDELRVVVDASTRIYLNGQRVPLDILPLGTQLLVAGTAEDGALRATIIGDLADMRPATQARAGLRGEHVRQLAAPSTQVAAADGETSLCIGQLMDYFLDEDVYEFQGCYGGPSVTDRFDLDPNIPIGCGIVGCWVIDEYSYTFALGGWGYDFPFRVSASSPGLVYHVPGTVSLGLAALGASGTGFTFAGGLGFDFGFNVDLCNPLFGGCVDAFTYHLSDFSMIHQTTEAGPLKPSDRLVIAPAACPGIGLIEIPGTPFEALELALCEDLHLDGRSFFARVRFDGARGNLEPVVGFDGTNQITSVTPDALFVDVSYREFSWTPDMTVGFSFQLNAFGFKLLESESITVGSGPFAAVSTPFPEAEGFTLATDPQSPDLLFQPEFADVAHIAVAPAPTTLAIISPPTLEEGSPLEARLTESFDGSPIAGATLRFTVTNANGTQQTAGTTDAGGIARLPLANGEHTVTVNFDGSPFYLPSAAGPQQVFVYQPTTFVIWGGNAGGIALGARYNFWGSQWHKQVTGGDFHGNASFKGYAHTATATSWVAGGGNSSRPPDHLGGLIGVIVSTVITRDGERTMGNVAQRVILRVENPRSYRPDPGHAAFGILTAMIAPPPIT